HPNSYLLGVAFANARDAGSSPFAQRKKVLTLFGDPTLATWSAEAGDIALSAAPSISIDNSIDNTLTVDINTLNEDASITLYKYNEVTDYPDVFSKQIIKAGDTTAEFILNPDTSGELLVSATAKNHLPATTTVDILM